MKLLNRIVPKMGVILDSSKSRHGHHLYSKVTMIITLVILIFQSQSWVVCTASSSDKESSSSSSSRISASADYTSVDDNTLIIDLDNVVGYGEDCSSEGPFCDPLQNLACDLEEEMCYCDAKNGYVHVGSLESDLTLFNFVTDDGTGEPKSNKVCMKSSELEERLDKLVNLTKKMKNIGSILMKYQKYLPKKYQDLLKLKDEL